MSEPPVYPGPGGFVPPDQSSVPPDQSSAPPDQPVVQPGQYGVPSDQPFGQPGQYPVAPEQYGVQPGRPFGQPGQYAAPPGQYGAQPGQYDQSHVPQEQYSVPPDPYGMRPAAPDAAAGYPLYGWVAQPEPTGFVADGVYYPPGTAPGTPGYGPPLGSGFAVNGVYYPPGTPPQDGYHAGYGYTPTSLPPVKRGMKRRDVIIIVLAIVAFVVVYAFIELVTVLRSGLLSGS